jgi:hypothetical protein
MVRRSSARCSVRSSRSCPRRSGAQNDARLCPGGAQGEGKSSRNREEVRGVRGLPEYRGSSDGSGGMASLRTDGLEAKKYWRKGEMVEEGGGFL